jgi:ribosomal protein L14
MAQPSGSTWKREIQKISITQNYSQLNKLIMAAVAVNICLTDVPKERLFKSDKTGKIYLNIVVADRKEKDRFDNTHTVFMQQTKEERDQRKEKIYVGDGKAIEYEQRASAPITEDDDLPF